MPDEIKKLLEAAVRKEMEARSIYASAQARISDPVHKNLLKALSEEEAQHIERVRNLARQGAGKKYWDEDKVRALASSEMVTGDALPFREDSDVRDILLYAIQREKNSIQLYSGMMQALKDKDARKICEDLAREERGHKIKIEHMYNDLYYG